MTTTIEETPFIEDIGEDEEADAVSVTNIKEDVENEGVNYIPIDGMKVG